MGTHRGDAEYPGKENAVRNRKSVQDKESELSSHACVPAEIKHYWLLVKNYSAVGSERASMSVHSLSLRMFPLSLLNRMTSEL